MAPILFMLQASPPVRAVLMAAKELGIELELEEVDILAEVQFKEEFIKLRMNPAHTIPTLNDDGFIIFESAAIMGYLVSKYGRDDSLYPKDVQKRAIVDQLLHFSTACYVLLLAVMKPVITFGRKKADITEESKRNLFEKVETLEELMGTEKFVAGNSLTVADFSLIAWVSTLNSAFPLPTNKFPKILTWWRRLEEIPSYSANCAGLSACASIWES